MSGMQEDEQPSFTIKKRTKSRPSGKTGGSLSRSASSTSLNSPAKLSFGAEDRSEEEEGGSGNVAVIRNRGKKTPAGRVREREGEGGGAAGGKGRSRLSFGAANDDEDEDDSVVVKRSTPSSTPRRLLRPTLPTSASSSSIAADSSAAAASPVANASSGTYSKDYLESLKAQQRSTPRSAVVAHAETSEGDGYDSLTRSKFGNEQLGNDTSILTTDSIARARARREEMRKSGATAPPAGSDYVSLDVGFASKGGDSRLVREEDEIGDGDEELAAYTDSLTSLPIGKKANKAAALKLRQEMGEMIDDVAMDVEEDDEEMREWEEAQVRRAGGGDERRHRRDQVDVMKAGKKPYRAAPIPQSVPIPTLTAALSRLTTTLSSLQATHTADASALLHFAREREDLDKQEQELREEVEKVEKKSLWFEEMKAEVGDWAAFLEEKFPALESIEAESLGLLRERYTIIASRRYQDASDDVALFSGQAVPTRFPPRHRSLDGGERMDEDRDRSEPDEESPEDLDPRSAARTSRRAEREARLSSSSPDPTTDDSLPPSSSSDLRAALTDQHSSLTSLFSDVRAPAFRDPNLGIRQKFEEWRNMWNEEYEMTFAGLGMVQVWEFWARVEVVGGWNPLEIEELPKSPADLSSYAWHQALSYYGHSSSQGHEGEDHDDQPDESTELINSLVTSVIIPRLSAIARVGYDPYSEKQTRAALKWVDEVSYCVEPSSPKFESLVLSFLHRLRLSIADLQTLLLPYLSSLTLPSLAYDPSNFTARHRFLTSTLPLLRSAQKWRRYLRAMRIPAVPTQLSEEDGGGVLEVGAGGSFDELIQRELVAKTLLPVVEAAWSTGGEEVAKQILETLPKDIPPALRRRLEGEEAAR
ncbi:hypothetical protein JCM11251_006727 [Rhodosporidiobolus azoricus]